MNINPIMHQRIRQWCAARGTPDFHILMPELSTPHNGGQCASMFECGGQTYVYKPRSPATDLAWAEFLDAIAPVLGAPMPGAVRPLPPYSDAYTIVPCIRSEDFREPEEIFGFYRSCGTLLALCLFLGSCDLHAENLIASGGRPWLIDVELILSGITPNHMEESPCFRSLLRSLLLPNWSLDSRGGNCDQGGLTAPEGDERLWAALFPACQYIGYIEEGFQAAFSAVLANREFISRELERFASVPIRKLLRSNDFYRRFRWQLAQIEDAAGRTEYARKLRRAYAHGDEGFEEKMQRALESEKSALLQNELPVFFSYGGERCLRDACGIVADDYYQYAPLEAARLRLNRLAPSDADVQLRILRQSLRCTAPGITAIPLSDPMELFVRLEARAFDASRSQWLGLQFDCRGKASFGGVGFSMANGLGGVLAFYAALYEATGASPVKDALYRRYPSLRSHYLRNPVPLKPRAANLSLTNGIGGHILILVYFASILSDPAFLQDALALLDRFPFEEYSDDAAWDVCGGSSGLLIALPALMNCGADGRIREIARRLAESIRHTDVQTCGFGSGAAGLALALGAAAHVLESDAYNEDILRLLAWENSQPDEKYPGQAAKKDADAHPGFLSDVLSGMPGIAIARMQLLRYSGNGQIQEICRNSLERVKAWLHQAAPADRDDLCSGNAARIEAECALTGRGFSQLNPSPVLPHPLDTDDFPVGLFSGWAGVGYALARQMNPGGHSLFLPRIKQPGGAI